MSFYICHCGNTANPNNFRHQFQALIEVSREKDDLGDLYKLDTTNYPIHTKKKCGNPAFQPCNYSKPIHGSSVLPHEYIESENKYREIKFTLPPDTECRNCKIELKEHHKVETHHFTTKVILNREKDDIVKIVHKDNERKILWE